MTTFEPPRRPARARRGRRDTIRRVVLVVVALALAFLFGMAFARTLDDRPQSSEPETIVRTLTPLPQDAPGRTVTVTVTATTP